MEEFNSLLPLGFRFVPTDEELLEHYLPRKVGGQTLEPLLADVIKETDLYKKEPEEIYAELNISEYDGLNKEFYFFTLVKKKFNSAQKYMNRVAGIGSWKEQNKKAITNLENTKVLGNMSTLNFQIGNRNCNPSWIMHEYTLPDSERFSEYWALCRVKRKTSGVNKASSIRRCSSSYSSASLYNKNNTRPLIQSEEGGHNMIFARNDIAEFDYFLPPGLRFMPTDRELLECYLPRKVGGQPLEPLLEDVIRETDLYRKEPGEIYAEMNISEYDGLNKEFYFFTLVKKKFNSGNSQKYKNRVAGVGSWKEQNKKEIMNLENTQVMGHISTLNFQIHNKNCSPSWIMHEYALPDSERLTEYWALCRIKRNGTGTRTDKATSVQHSSSAFLCNKNKRPLVQSDDSDLRNHNKKHHCDASISYAQPEETTWETGVDSIEWPNLPPLSELYTWAVDEGKLYSSLEPPTLPPHIHLPGLNNEVPAEPDIDECGTSGIYAEDSYVEGEYFDVPTLLAQLCTDPMSSGLEMAALHTDELISGLPNPYFADDGASGLLLA